MLFTVVDVQAAVICPTQHFRPVLREGQAEDAEASEIRTKRQHLMPLLVARDIAKVNFTRGKT